MNWAQQRSAHKLENTVIKLHSYIGSLWYLTVPQFHAAALCGNAHRL